MKDKTSVKQNVSYIMPIITGCIGGLAGTLLVALMHLTASFFRDKGFGFWQTTNLWGGYLLDMAVASVTAFLLSWMLYRRREKKDFGRADKGTVTGKGKNVRQGVQAAEGKRKISGQRKQMTSGNSLWKETEYAEEIIPVKERRIAGTKLVVEGLGIPGEIGTCEPEGEGQAKTGVIYSPIQGQVVPMEEVPDDTFAAKVLGDGLAVIPSEGIVFAPFDGRVEMVYDAKNAVSVSSLDGMEVLIHIGVNTVDLAGKCFKTCVSGGDQIQKGDELLYFDLAGIKEAGYTTVSPIILTNSDDYDAVCLLGHGMVDNGDVLIQI